MNEIRMWGQANDSATISLPGFTVQKFHNIRAQVDLRREHKDDLFKWREKHSISEAEFQEQLNSAVDSISSLRKEYDVLSQEMKFIDEDMEEMIESAQLQKEEGESDLQFFERVYALVRREEKSVFNKHDQASFRQSVLRHYGAVEKSPSCKMAYCHLTGWWDSSAVNAVYLVPQQLAGSDITALFGVSGMSVNDPRNGILLNKNIELALETGKIAIVPSLEGRCKCVLVDQDIPENIVFRDQKLSGVMAEVKWKDLDNRELCFLSSNQPARRFLYLRLIMTYIQARMNGNTAFSLNVWKSKGSYLGDSTLAALVRNISGVELPTTYHTFTSWGISHTEADNIGASLASELRKAIIENSKRLSEEVSDEEMEVEDDESDSGDEAFEMVPSLRSIISGPIPIR